jgi:hypothetical protein
MTHIEQAIRDVEKGGWTCKGFLNEEGLGTPSWGITQDNKFVVSKVQIGFGGDPARNKYEVLFPEIALDLAFWQALSKARGWDNSTATDKEETWWLHHWHLFIDHLADGGDSDSFFEALV